MGSSFNKLIVALDRKAAKDGTETPKFLGQFTRDIGLQNLLSNGNFADWTAGDTSAPDGWTLDNGAIAKESTTIYINSFSAKLTRSGSDAVLSQDVATTRGIAYFKGKTITVSAWAAGASNFAALRISDGVDSTESTALATTTAFGKLDVTHTVNASATQVKIELLTKQDGNVFFDGLIALEGELPFAFTPQSGSGGGGGPSTDTLDNVCDRGATTDQTITAAGFTTTGAASLTGSVTLGNSDIAQVTVNSAFTLPTADGTVGQVLTTNGTGTVGWATPASSATYTTSFTNGDLVSGILSVNHGLGYEYLRPAVYDENDEIVIPTKVKSIDANNTDVYLTGFAPITGTWHVRLSL